MVVLPAHLLQHRKVEAPALLCGGIVLQQGPCILNQSLSHGEVQYFTFHGRCVQGRRQGDTRDTSCAPRFTPDTRARPSACAGAG